ncbi:fasciclin domain-containing protein [Christiangramia sp. SM2212]|uniref:Fasciclin domain-containing protein n=1 Tax=Christiangramia sediminicola TaxID=3073267 RepID=A0ABU1EU30_9FLAO|nr:fasciclin domain-containing protein [Christiangramia sp. SM2212]MDR5591903.1 fasciclin domain-containing protein [Christiangramia sp. SM2212]
MKNFITTKNLLFTSLFFALILIFASCEKDPISEEITSVDANAKASPASQQSDLSIVAIAEADGRFTTLLSLLEQTGLKPMFETGTDQYTVFAPTDDAFATFLEENPTLDPTDNELLTAVLTYHVTEGQRFSNSVLGKKSAKEIETVNGASIYVDSKGDIDTNDEDMIFDDASILVEAGLFDIAASNGVIHVIDAVLVPTE